MARNDDNDMRSTPDANAGDSSHRANSAERGSHDARRGESTNAAGRHPNDPTRGGAGQRSGERNPSSAGPNRGNR